MVAAKFITVSGKAHHQTLAILALAANSLAELFHATRSVGDQVTYSGSWAISGDIDITADAVADVAVAVVADVTLEADS